MAEQINEQNIGTGGRSSLQQQNLNIQGDLTFSHDEISNVQATA
jgi:hypothetical protein